MKISYGNPQFYSSGLQQQEDSLLKWIPVICILVFISAGTPGLLTLPWMMSSEMFPHEVIMGNWAACYEQVPN